MHEGINRRWFLAQSGSLLLGGVAGMETMARLMDEPAEARQRMTLFICGDVMTGRGIDQVLPHPGDPTLHESYAQSARVYVGLAERAHGPIPRSKDFAYVWGDALMEWKRAAPDVRIVNLETSITTRDEWQRGKGIHYRMHPANVSCLTAASIDCCVLANNHVLDWGYAGLTETLETLRRVKIGTSGAGRDSTEATAPAILPVANKGRVLVFSFGTASSGIPADWAAGAGTPGVSLLPDLSEATQQHIAAQVKAIKQPGDVVVASIHWGGNWDYAVPREHVTFAHGLIDTCGVDVVHGHSSHHPLGIEVYRDRPILYGCGDFLNDYEGIGGYEGYRGDLSLMYFLNVNPASGRLLRLWMQPMQLRRFQLNRASVEDKLWLREALDRESLKLGCRVELGPDGSLELRWG